MAVLLDDAGVFPEMSVAEHLDLLARVHGVEDPEAAVAEVLDEVGLLGAADQLPATLSSGQRQRLLLGSCFVRPREVLLLDEPEQRLDVPGRAWLARKLVSEKESGVGVLLSCHDPELADAVADWVLELA
jgi:ABC-type multidrug transport system ATPase subunit